MSAQLRSSRDSFILNEVNEQFGLPFQPYEFQRTAIEELGFLDRTGWYAEPGCGKTLMSTLVALHKVIDEPNSTVLVIMPPILINSWQRWLKSIKGIGKVVAYRGSPAARKELQIGDAQFLLMSMQIFKKDLARFERDLATRTKIGIIDEAHSIKNASSGNHKAVRDFFKGQHLMLLTGTPLSKPSDVYGYVKLISPLIYLSFRQFMNIHVAEVDYFGNVTKWRNLELLQKNWLVNSCRMLKEHVLVDLKQPVYTPIHYPLEPEHLRLYEDLMAEQLLEFESGMVIDATSATRLYHASQQIVLNHNHFANDQSKRSAGFDVLDEVISELGIDQGSDKKLIVFSLYKMTNRAVVAYLRKFGAVACFSEISRTQQDKNIERFMTDPTCQVLVAQPLSAGFGLNLQDVCSDVLFLETPVVPMQFHQAVARVYREGQRNTPNVRIAIAEHTIQGRLHSRLLENDALVNKIQIGFKDLKEAIYGS